MWARIKHENKDKMRVWARIKHENKDKMYNVHIVWSGWIGKCINEMEMHFVAELSLAARLNV